MLDSPYTNATGRIKNGKYKEFNKRAVLIAEGVYMNDQKHGQWKEYYDNGQIMIEEDYHHGIQHGRFASFHPNGQLFSEGNFKNGKRDGYFRVYTEEGKPMKTLLFVNDIKIEEIDLVRSAVPIRKDMR